VFLFISIMLVVGLLSGCVNPRTTSHTPRTSVEQLLLTQAVSKSLKKPDHQEFPLTSGATVKIDPVGLTGDQTFIGEAVEDWLGEKGYQIRQMNENATYRIHILINTFGTEQGASFLGMPQIQSTFIPFSLPEIPIFRIQRQRGQVQFHMNIFDAQTGKLIETSNWHEGDTFHHFYTILFFFSFVDTDLIFDAQ